VIFTESEDLAWETRVRVQDLHETEIFPSGNTDQIESKVKELGGDKWSGFREPSFSSLNIIESRYREKG
jgi:hypothetical protein